MNRYLTFLLKLSIRIASIIGFIALIRYGGARLIIGIIIGMSAMGWILLTENIQVKTILRMIGVAKYENNTKEAIKEEGRKYTVKFKDS